MNRFKGTPAPWVIDKEHELASEDYHFILSGAGYHSEKTNKGFNIANYMSKYDANLIASAPELLETLQIICFYEDIPKPQREIAEKAIAKALGEEK